MEHHYKASLIGISIVILAGIGLAVFNCRQQLLELSVKKEAVVPSPETTTVSGLAQNAAAGAVLITDTGEVVYIEGLTSWEETLVATRVQASGELTETKYIPDPGQGELRAGAEGNQKVLKNAVWNKAL